MKCAKCMLHSREANWKGEALPKFLSFTSSLAVPWMRDMTRLEGSTARPDLNAHGVAAAKAVLAEAHIECCSRDL